MRLLAFSLWLLLPLASMAMPICPAGYMLNSQKMCEQKWQLDTGDCPDGSYYNTRAKNCTARCPYRSVQEMSSLGDYVCQVDGKREWLQEYSKKCVQQSMRYSPQINMCIAVKKTKKDNNNNTEEGMNCPTGQAWHMQDGDYTCHKVDRKRVAQQLKQKLQTKGLKYEEYLAAIKDIQTNKLAAQALQFRWEEATGQRQTQEQKAAAMAPAHCPDQYVPNAAGGCKPSQPCNAYACPNGQISALFYEGKNQYCSCVPQNR